MASRAYLILVIAGCAVAAASAKRPSILEKIHDEFHELLHPIVPPHPSANRPAPGPANPPAPRPVNPPAPGPANPPAPGPANPPAPGPANPPAPGPANPPAPKPTEPIARDVRSCVARKYNYDSVVCVCNAKYCDEAPSEPAGGVVMGRFLRVVSTVGGRRLHASEGDMIYSDRPQPVKIGPDSESDSESDSGSQENQKDDVVFDFRPYTPRQRIQGFGGALTDSAAGNILGLSDATRTRLLRAYFGDDGSRYQFVRVPMGGSDFSTREYSYDDNNGAADPSLANFGLAQEDIKLKIPVLLEAQKAASQPLKLFTAPWNAPSWMVNTLQDGFNKLNEDYLQSWADYFVKFLDAYKSWGLSFWGLTTQNEPSDGFVVNYGINRLGWSPESMRQWLGSYLIPTLKKKNSDVKILIHDDQRSRLPEWPARTLNDSAVRDAVDGIAVHWYADSVTDPAVLTETHNLFPEKFLLYTEASDGPFQSGGEAVQLGNWKRGVNYARDIIQVLSNWVTGWVDWNLALDLSGGPTWASNNLDAAIIVNATADEFYKQPSYYAIQHFSRYVPPGSFNAYLQPIAASNPGSGEVSDAPKVSAAGFVTPEGRFVIVFVNEDSVPRRVAVGILGVVYYRDVLAPHSIQTTVAHPRPFRR